MRPPRHRVHCLAVINSHNPCVDTPGKLLLIIFSLDDFLLAFTPCCKMDILVDFRTNAGYSAVWVYGDCRTLPCPIGVPTLVTIVDAMVLAITRASVYYYDDSEFFWRISPSIYWYAWLLGSCCKYMWWDLNSPIGIKPQCTSGTVAPIAHSTRHRWSAVGFANTYLH